MLTIELVALAGVLVVGVAMTYFGYETAQTLLATSGLVGGAVVGGWLGLIAGAQLGAGQFTGGSILVFLICSVVGASIGRSLMPVLGQLAVGILGFVGTAIGGLFLFAQDQPGTLLTQTVPAVIETGNSSLLISRLQQVEFVGGVSPTAALAGIFLVGAAGGAISLAYSDLLLGAVVTLIGAVVLSAVVPVVLEYSGFDHMGVASASSTVWILVFAASGVIVGLARHGPNPGRTHVRGLRSRV